MVMTESFLGTSFSAKDFLPNLNLFFSLALSKLFLSLGFALSEAVATSSSSSSTSSGVVAVKGARVVVACSD